MTKQEAEEIVEKMNKGLAFSDEDVFTNERWSLSYDKVKNQFSYTTMWMVIGSILSDTKFTKEELLSVLVNKFDYKKLMTNSYWMDSSSILDEAPNSDGPKAVE